MKTKNKKIKNHLKKMPFLLFGFLLGSAFFFLVANIILNSQFKHLARKELKYWKEISLEYPKYPDAWAKMAVCWYNLNKKELAQLAIQKARKLDPIREEIKSLEAKIFR